MNLGLNLGLGGTRGGGFSPASLFATGEQGAWYDPSDLSTLFQDSAGTTPVTAAAQPVGLWLDKSQGLVLGSELVTNGGFATDTNWTKGAGWTITGGAAVATSVAAFGELSQAAGIAVGSYRVSLTVTVTSGAGFIRLGTTGNIGSFNATGTYSFILQAGAAGSNVRILADAAGFTGTIDNVSVKLLPGNHATQSNAAQRPTYGIVPATGRRNTYTNTNDLTNTTNWNTGVISNGTRSGAGVSVSTDEGYAYIARPVNADIFVSGVAYTFSATVVCDQTVANVPLRFTTPFGNSAALVNMVAGVPQRITWTITASASGTGRSEFGIDARNAIVPGGSNATGYVVTFSDPQLEVGSTATNYQRVGTAFDVTEAGVASRSYLSFDGTDDGMLTGNIVPGTDKAQVFAGLRKLSDAASGVVVETSADAFANNGAAGLLAPSSTGANSYRFSSRGTAVANAGTGVFAAAPDTAVLTGTSDIAAPNIVLRRNGAQVEASTGTQGAGNYLTYPLYIGRRGGISIPFNGQIYGLIVRFGANLPAATITQTETWLNQRTGAF